MVNSDGHFNTVHKEKHCFIVRYESHTDDEVETIGYKLLQNRLLNSVRHDDVTGVSALCFTVFSMGGP